METSSNLQMIGLLLMTLSGLIILFIIIRLWPKKLKRKDSFKQKMKNLSEAAFQEKSKGGILEHQKGYEFEKYVVSKFPEVFALKEWRGDKFHAGKYAESSMLPDLEYVLKTKYKEVPFAVECKWRKSFFEGKLDWAKQHQLDIYKKYERETGKPVFIILGVGGSPDNPNEVYIIPLKEINSITFARMNIQKYYRHRRSNFFLFHEKMHLE